MAVDLIDVLLQVQQISSITIVGVDHEQLTGAANPRLRSFPISQPVDINSDLQMAIGGSKRIAIFLPDLPSVKTAEILQALELANTHHTSFIADQNSIGSTAFFSTVGRVATHFGANSAIAHRSAQAIELIDPEFKGIKADCDDWSDLLAINSSDLGHATRALMEHHLQNQRSPFRIHYMTETTELYPGKELKNLTVGIIGGTGAQGTGLGYRLAKAGFKVILGSRDGAKAIATAAEVGQGITGADNTECAAKSDLVIVAVPWDSHKETLTSLKNELAGKVVIDCVNPMGFDAGGAFPLAVEEGSACAQAQGILSESHVVTAFNHVSAVLLSDQSLAQIDIDIMVVGDHKPATDLVQQMVDQIAGMRGIYAGKMRNAGQVEALTANLISMNRRYKTHAGVRVIGVN